jgi:hypothetical protein
MQLRCPQNALVQTLLNPDSSSFAVIKLGRLSSLGKGSGLSFFGCLSGTKKIVS